MIKAGGGAAHWVENRRRTDPNLLGLGLEGAELRLVGVETPMSVGLWSKDTQHASRVHREGFLLLRGLLL